MSLDSQSQIFHTVCHSTATHMQLVHKFGAQREVAQHATSGFSHERIKLHISLSLKLITHLFKRTRMRAEKRLIYSACVLVLSIGDEQAAEKTHKQPGRGSLTHV